MRIGVLLALTVSALTPCGAARAEAPPGDAQESAYRAAFERAERAFERGQYEQAKAAFAKAHALQPSARSLRGLGLSSYALGRYVAALGLLEAALASTVQPLTPAMCAALHDVVARARRSLGRLEIALEPASAELRLDGQPVTLEARASLLLDPGVHELWAFAPGYAALRRRVTAASGSRFSLQLTLLQLTAAARASSEAASARAAEVAPAPGQHGWAPVANLTPAPFVLIGSSVALAAVGGTLLGLGLADKAAVEAAEDGVRWVDKQLASDRSVPFQTTGGVLLGLGLAGVVAGLLWQLELGAEQDSLIVRSGQSGAAVEARF